MVKPFMVAIYAWLIKYGKRNIESIPEIYREPVAIKLAEQEEGNI